MRSLAKNGVFDRIFKPLWEAISTIASFNRRGFLVNNMKKLDKSRRTASKLFPYSRIDPYEKWIPQFPDESGWNTTYKDFPYFYEHITEREVHLLQHERSRWQKQQGFRINNEKTYKAIAIMVDPDFGHPNNKKSHNHKNTYFVKGNYLEHFLAGFLIDNYYDEQFVSIEVVQTIPSFKEKLKI